MLTQYTRDATLTIAWLGLMAFVWLGWSQEDPLPRQRIRLVAGSVLGMLLAGGAAGHFLPLAWLLSDPWIAALGAMLLAALAVLTGRLQRSARTTSRTVGPLMGAGMLCYAVAAGTILAATSIG